ncbi:MAG: single-stranded DNA-binding protein [Candidatus Margulisiibacteriota bacterium]|nr:MAG: hypothetical protein A2X42_10270 [Candidatus Margulisbacteria bacterium GWF2_38_17]OGI08208.1 MAG: hypothetical protein A2X41_00685 [Candidatus Margulisbacteria bacterium GWE2_39_32]PZM79680.1 MAG: single-stranded DNA-binding protein [Candidatus Margulisiibacteriota bacterium]HCT85079.1 single-stranded DNA-binding protein [Candidatus Margulisiibacteriota bacterium]HCY35716.1 single-stranded DNA-binding protein [Candidatus Margulisiibacteriota bacterium]
MANLNKIILVGNLTADPEMRFTVDGSAVTKYRLAVQRPPKSDGGESGVDFIPIVTFGRLAEISGEYLKKGKTVLVEGRIQVRSYTTTEGQSKWATEVIANVMRMLDKKGMEETPSGSEKATEAAGAGSAVDLDSEDALYDDIPF